MLTGHVTPAREAVVQIEVHGPIGTSTSIDGTIDTGFDGELTLPPFVVSELELAFAGGALATLADGTTASLDLFVAAVEWHGARRQVLVVQTDGGALLGMTMLDGSRLVVDVTEGGRVVIQEL